MESPPVKTPEMVAWESMQIHIPYKGMSIFISKPKNTIDVYSSSKHPDHVTLINHRVYPEAKVEREVPATTVNLMRALTWIDKYHSKAQMVLSEDSRGSRWLPVEKEASVNIKFSQEELDNVLMFKNSDDYVAEYGPIFSRYLEVENVAGMLTAHGDKARQYRDRWLSEGLCYGKACLLHLLSYTAEYAGQVRQTRNGFVPPVDWVIKTYKDKAGKPRQVLDTMPDWCVRRPDHG